MALLHQAELRPTKLELLATWLPTRVWAGGPNDGSSPVERVGAYRFDDPDGEVGVETLLVRFGGRLLQVPLTYRGHPAEGLDPHLVGTLDHSVLGQRWVYDACGDPVYAAALATAIRTGGTEAEEIVEIDGERRRRSPSVTVRGTGGPTGALGGTERPPVHEPSAETAPAAGVIAVDGETATRVSSPWADLIVVRVLPGPIGATGATAPGDATEGPRLLGRWDGAPHTVTLAHMAG